MTKTNIKYVFLAIFTAISIKGLALGFDLAGSAYLLVSAAILFAYDYVSSESEMTTIKQELTRIASVEQDLIKEIQQIKSARSVQNISTPSFGSGGQKTSFPPRL